MAKKKAGESWSWWLKVGWFGWSILTFWKGDWSQRWSQASPEFMCLSGETQCAQVCSFSSCRHRLMGIRFSHKFSWGKKRPGREIREVLAQSYLLNGFFIVFHEACTELLSLFKFLFWLLFPFSLPPQFSHPSRKSYLWKTSVTLAEITSSNDFNIQMDNIFSNRLGVA